MSIEITVSSQYGTLSRGKHSARKGGGGAVTWAAKDPSGNLVISEPGTWMLHCTDGFNRVARATLVVKGDGSWKMSGDSNRFDVS